MFYLTLKNKKVQGWLTKATNPIMLCFKVRDIHVAPPGNPYFIVKKDKYINFLVRLENE